MLLRVVVLVVVLLVATAASAAAPRGGDDCRGLHCVKRRVVRGRHGPDGQSGATGPTGLAGSQGATGATGPAGTGTPPSFAFFNTPQRTNWTIEDGEVQVYSIAVPVTTADTVLVVDAAICAWISQVGGSAFNTYTLYVNDQAVSRGGFEAELDNFGPNLETSSLLWSGIVNPPVASINVTATLADSAVPSTDAFSSIAATANAFPEDVGAFLQYLLFV